METCTTETGLFRKKPCGHVAVAKCLNCEQSLCVKHAVAQVTDAGNRTGKFLCQECVDAQKVQSESMADVARVKEVKRLAAIENALMKEATAPTAAKPPPSRPSPTPAQPAPAVQSRESDALEFTPSDGKSGYTRKKDESA